MLRFQPGSLKVAHSKVAGSNPGVGTFFFLSSYGEQVVCIYVTVENKDSVDI